MHKISSFQIWCLLLLSGLKIVGTGACLPWCSIFYSFQNSLKTSGHRGYEFLEFWYWNLFPFLPDIGFQLFFFFFALSCWNRHTQGLPWNRRCLEGSICCSKTFYIPFSIHSAFQNMQTAHTICIYAPPYLQRCWLLITRWKVSLLFSPEEGFSSLRAMQKSVVNRRRDTERETIVHLLVIHSCTLGGADQQCIFPQICIWYMDFASSAAQYL